MTDRKCGPLNSPVGAAKRAVPESLRAYCWPKGKSGNPGGFNGEHGEALRLAREASPIAMRRLIRLIDSDDERVAVVACNAILDRALGKPKETVPPPIPDSPEVIARRNETREFLIAALNAKAEGKW